MNGYAKYFDNNNKYMNLLVNDEKFLGKYSEILDKISILLKKGLIVSHCLMINTLRQK